jgi:hypothetical protein
MSKQDPPDHNPDCDGFMSVHVQTVERMPQFRGIRRLVCEEDGPVTGYCGPGVADASLRRLAKCHPTEVACDGRCLDWPQLP